MTIVSYDESVTVNAIAVVEEKRSQFRLETIFNWSRYAYTHLNRAVTPSNNTTDICPNMMENRTITVMLEIYLLEETSLDQGLFV